MDGQHPGEPLVGPVREPRNVDEEPTLRRKLAYTGTEVASEVAKYAVGEAVGSAFSTAYMFVLAIGALGILIVALIVVSIGWMVSILALAGIAPDSGVPITAFWGVVGLAILFFGIRWLVRRVGRAMERGLDRTLATVDRGKSNATTASLDDALPPIGTAVQPTLAELDARLAPREPPG